MEEKPNKDVPKKSCMITLMIPIDDDVTALNIKKGIDDLIKDISEKRYTFQIHET